MRSCPLFRRRVTSRFTVSKQCAALLDSAGQFPTLGLEIAAKSAKNPLSLDKMTIAR